MVYLPFQYLYRIQTGSTSPVMPALFGIKFAEGTDPDKAQQAICSSLGKVRTGSSSAGVMKTFLKANLSITGRFTIP